MQHAELDPRALRTQNNLLRYQRISAVFTWTNGFVWDNPDETTTINCRGLQRDQTPQVQITVEGDRIVTSPSPAGK